MKTGTRPLSLLRLQQCLSRVAMLGLLATVLAVGGAGWVLFGQDPEAPNVQFTTLQGEKFSTADLQGKVVLVNFWATSCETCMREMPTMVETYKRYQDKGLEFVAVAMAYDTPEYVVHYANTRQLPFKVAMDRKGEAARRFGDVQLTPTTFLIDKKGRIVRQYLGEPDFAELRKLIEGKLAA